MAVGTLAAVAGAGLDAWRHLSDATRVHHAAVLSCTHPVDGATERLLQSQLAEARAAALRYPTVTDALRGGYTLADPYYQGIGAHYMRYAEIDDVFDPARPEMLLYAGEEPTSPVVGI